MIPRLLLRTSLLCLLSPPLLAERTSEPENILVTASRIEENAMTLPLSWTTLSEQTIEFVNPVHINEIMQRVPGAWISRGNGQESLISLRSPVLTGAGSCGAFLTASDSISVRAPGFCNVNQLFDTNFEQAGRIEVIRGPASALYGSNAMHGVINVISAAPSEQVDHRISLEGGPYSYARGKYRYGDTVGSHGISVNANATHDGGYKKSSGYDQQKVTLRHDYSGSQWDVRTVLDGANLNQDTAGFIRGFKAFKDGSGRKENPNPDAYRDAWSGLLYSAASRALSDVTTVTLTPYLRANDMDFLMHFLSWQPVEKNSHNSLGLRSLLNHDADGLRWLGGIDLEYTDAKLKETQADNFSDTIPAGVHYDYHVGATVAAAFGQVRSQWSTPWELDGGVRFEYTNYDYDNRAGDGSACDPSVSGCRFYRPADREDNFSEWSLNAGASYSLSADHVVYLRLARGFRAPQATELYRLQAGQQMANLDPERLDSVELGFRGYIEDRFRYDMATFYMEKKDVIFQDSNRRNVSGAKTRHYGAELGLDITLTEHWSLGVDGIVASHTYDNSVPLFGTSDNIKGNDVDTSPKAFGSAHLDWDFSHLTGRASRAELEWVYLDNYYLEPQNEHEYRGHSLFNLRVTSTLTQRFSAGLRITNLLDKDYAERADFGFGDYRYFVGQPRGAYLEVSYQFGDV
ncbi:MAG: TonB-dependent receptor [Halioglobus sp.]|nr:TonB-dependent receptor [Halioglobus sp.]